MDTTDSGSPISSSDWDKVHLGNEESTLNGDLDLLGKLDSETNMSVSVSDSDDSLESGSLSGLGLLLDGKDAHDLIGELVLGVGDKSVNDWCFLDWDGMGINLLEGLDLAGLDESSELGEWSPLITLESTSASWTTSSSASSTSIASTTSISSSGGASSGSESSSASAVCWWCCYCFHFYECVFLAKSNNN